MVWLSKREIASLLLLSIFFKNKFNLGEALDVLKVMNSKRIARKILKRLVAKGFLKQLNAVEYEIEPLEQAFLKYLRGYIIQRIVKTLKSYGIDVELLRHGLNDVLEIDCADSEDLAQHYGVRQVPTMVIYENENSTLWHKEGVVLAQDIEKIIGL